MGPGRRRAVDSVLPVLELGVRGGCVTPGKCSEVIVHKELKVLSSDISTLSERRREKIGVHEKGRKSLGAWPTAH